MKISLVTTTKYSFGLDFLKRTMYKRLSNRLSTSNILYRKQLFSQLGHSNSLVAIQLIDQIRDFELHGCPSKESIFAQTSLVMNDFVIIVFL